MSSMALAARRMAPVARQRLAPALAAPRPRLMAVRAAASSAAAEPASASRSAWELKLLYDGQCPLCMREIDFLRSRNGEGKLAFVDIAEPDYDPADNANISFDQAMAYIHAIAKDGRVLTGVEAFRYTYELIGLGYVYAVTKLPGVMPIANAVYDLWAKYRTQLTGREVLGVILERRKLEEAGKASCRTVGEAQACEVKAP
ncbi:hypothetical protein HYH03_006558 [Edaphochlamys debaryana]|uniref:Thiol-disulfide oxidoreductase DCC n=1 Tax=Edaphochlamys debaryana TaxID=47281 RepID=A0A835Y3F3_9CHLO|nr:hypothetical protein HYH03_006558 [Edaphochlamys debaryana]|eukprot:KAG2495285.1 hypothetical protein HYH03_006558 [Edaphochlamys debaryana]